MKHYRVKYGHGKDDFISIEEGELWRAIKAQGTGTVAVFKEGTVSGNHVITILPDYNRDMGWHRDYQLGGEDYEQIGNAKMREYQNLLESAKTQFQPMTEKEKLVIPDEIKKLSAELAESKRM